MANQPSGRSILGSVILTGLSHWALVFATAQPVGTSLSACANFDMDSAIRVAVVILGQGIEERILSSEGLFKDVESSLSVVVFLVLC